MQSDVAHIQRINLLCLPENYQKHCFWAHILRWPSIVRVAEARVPRSCYRSDSGAASDEDQDTEWAVVAYVLAKIDDDAAAAQEQAESGGFSMQLPLDGCAQGDQSVKGHITSLAVLPSHRRLGIAKRCRVFLPASFPAGMHPCAHEHNPKHAHAGV